MSICLEEKYTHSQEYMLLIIQSYYPELQPDACEYYCSVDGTKALFTKKKKKKFGTKAG